MSYAFICIRGVAIPAAPGQSPERAAHWRIRRKRFLPNGGFRGCLGVGCVRTSVQCSASSLLQAREERRNDGGGLKAAAS